MSEPNPNYKRDLAGSGEWAHAAVPPGCQCPECQEWCMDLLVWIDDETVECQTCKRRYNPTAD